VLVRNKFSITDRKGVDHSFYNPISKLDAAARVLESLSYVCGFSHLFEWATRSGAFAGLADFCTSEPIPVL